MRLAYALLSSAFALCILGAVYFSSQKEVPAALRPAPKETFIQSSSSLPENDSTTHTSMLKLVSPEFAESALIPSRFTCDGENIHPELRVTNIPDGVVSLVLFMTDPDIPDFVKKSMHIDVFDHWVLFNLPAGRQVFRIEEGVVPQEALEGSNSSGKIGYIGPCPPDGQHRYFLKLYALDRMLELKEGATRSEVEKAMEGHTLDFTILQAVYTRAQERE